MEIYSSAFMLIGVLVLLLYVAFVFILFLPTLGFGIVPVIIVAAFGIITVISGYFYNQISLEQVNMDNVYIMSMTIIASIFFVVVAFAIWFVYIQYSNGKEKAIEDINQNDMPETPFTSNKNY